jgi:hypothetical protein
LSSFWHDRTECSAEARIAEIYFVVAGEEKISWRSDIFGQIDCAILRKSRNEANYSRGFKSVIYHVNVARFAQIHEVAISVSNPVRVAITRHLHVSPVSAK